MTGTEQTLPPVVLCIAATDPVAGAGLLADVRLAGRLGAYPAGVVTALTVQNTQAFTVLEPVAPDLVRAQLEAVLSDLTVAAVKIGALGSLSTALVVAETLERLSPRPPVVLDPVRGASTGGSLVKEGEWKDAMAALAPLASVITPNEAEAQALAGLENFEQAELQAALASLGAGALLVKSVPGERGLSDVLVTSDALWSMAGPRLPYEVHGTGCALSTALAVLLAKGHDLLPAARQARAVVLELVQHALPLGKGEARLWSWPG